MLEAVTQALSAAVLATAAVASQAAASPGERLFNGLDPLVSSLAGRQEPLPTAASRCVNCHRTSAAPRPALAARLGPMLTPVTLRTAWPRRGGPPSGYGLPAFCRLLRTGVDPAQVLIDTRMPRYAATDAECAALWSFLVKPPDTPAELPAGRQGGGGQAVPGGPRSGGAP